MAKLNAEVAVDEGHVEALAVERDKQLVLFDFAFKRAQVAAIENAVGILANVASVRGVARVDFLANEHELYVNEINTIPGSLAKYLFVDPPLSFTQLLSDLLAEATERPAHRYSAAGADGLVLRSAGSIAAKLA
jgi:D-alanine-D-alanine ligase